MLKTAIVQRYSFFITAKALSQQEFKHEIFNLSFRQNCDTPILHTCMCMKYFKILNLCEEKYFIKTLNVRIYTKDNFVRKTRNIK